MMHFSAVCLFTALMGSVSAATDWEKEASEAQWAWPHREPTLLSAAMDSIESPYEVVIVRLPYETASKRFADLGGFYPFDLKFVRDGKVLFERPAHERTAFLLLEDRLILANVPPGTFGCKIIAFDLVAKKQLWATQLKALGSTSHSAYSNRVSLKLSKGAVRIFGWETQGKYVEYIDCKTGRSLGHRIFEHGP